MKYNHFLLCVLFLLGSFTIQAQEKTTMTLEEAIRLALTQSTEIKLADTKVMTKQFELQSVKNNQYPSFKLAGQYQRITNADLNLKIGNTTNNPSTPTPKVHELLLGQATVSMPLYSGSRIKNKINVSNALYRAEDFTSAHTKEQMAVEVVKMYVSLYKAQESVVLIEENIKNAQQRVTDFSAMEQNGLLARNDLLRAQLQLSSFQVSLEEAKKNVIITNYQLVTLLKLPEGRKINPDETIFKRPINLEAIHKEEAIESRNDLESLRWKQKASESEVKIAKGAYYPSLTLLGGYVALDLQHVMTVYNAINFGVGVSYDVATIFKNGKEVKVVKNHAFETEQAVEMLTDQIKIQVQQAEEDYKLSIKQNNVYNLAVDQAVENYRIVKDKYDYGLATTNELLDADVEQLQSKINQTFSKANSSQKYYELLAASGKLTQSFSTIKN